MSTVPPVQLVPTPPPVPVEFPWHSVLRWLLVGAVTISLLALIGTILLLTYIWLHHPQLRRQWATAFQASRGAVSAFIVGIKLLSDALIKMWSAVGESLGAAKFYLLMYRWRLLFSTRTILPSAQLSLFVVAGTVTIMQLGMKIGRGFAGYGLDPIWIYVALNVLVLWFISRGFWLRLYKKHPLSPFQTVVFIVSAGVIVFEMLGFRSVKAQDLLDSVESLPALLVLFSLEFLILLHDFHEFHKRGRHRLELGILNDLFVQLARANEGCTNSNTAQDRHDAESAFRTACMTAIIRIFQGRGIDQVDFTIMKFYPDLNCLKIDFIPKDSEHRFDKTFAPSPGVGAAGTAFQNETLVYLPNIKYKHGIEVFQPVGQQDYNRLGFLDSVYKAVSIEPFRCMLCARIDGPPGFSGVLNISSPKPNAFSKSEFLLATLAASILGTMS